MILAVYGTTGELIKLAPILRRLREHGVEALTATTAQQYTQIPSFVEDLDVPEPTWWLARGARGRDLEHRADIPRWLAGCVSEAARRRAEIRARLRAGSGQPLVLIHGDTMTTVLGALLGRALRMPVAHVEAGLRSGSLREPFPEELDRRVTSRLATIHFAPGPWAARNLRDAKVRGQIVDSGGNTVSDAIWDCPPAPPPLDLPDVPFGVISLHREELLRDEARFRGTVDLLAGEAQRMPLLFVEHSVTMAAVRRFGLQDRFDDRFRLVPRLPHPTFIGLVRNAACLVTDSGGSQEECTALGVPCLIHRRRTERLDGIAEGTVVLSGLELGPITAFLADQRAAAGAVPVRPRVSPSQVIVDWLVSAGFA